MRLMAIDPGKMTGWFVIDFTTLDWMGGELPQDEFLDWMEPSDGAVVPLSNSPLVLWRLDRVVMEGFHITQRTSQTNPTDEQLWSVQQIGVVKMWCRRLAISYERQMPSAKSFDKNGDKLKKLGWYAPSPGAKGEAGHRRDAARHALKWGVDHRVIPLESLL